MQSDESLKDVNGRHTLQLCTASNMSDYNAAMKGKERIRRAPLEISFVEAHHYFDGRSGE